MRDQQQDSQSAASGPGAMPPDTLRPTLAARPGSALAKRLFDLVAVLAGLWLIWPLLLAIALWVKLDSPGPV